MKFETKVLSDWIITDDYCAMRIVEGGDPECIAHRVAFIEKTPRVRVKPYDGKGWCLESNDNWLQGPKGQGGQDGGDPENELYGFFPPSREWCDIELMKLGYLLPNDLTTNQHRE